MWCVFEPLPLLKNNRNEQAEQTETKEKERWKDKEKSGQKNGRTERDYERKQEEKCVARKIHIETYRIKQVAFAQRK